jgi:DinB family protein
MLASYAQRPATDEYAPYFERYISLIPDQDVLKAIEKQLPATVAFLRSIPAERAGFRYAPEKWTVREVIGHVIDAERVFAYRALCFARGDSAELPGFDENAYVQNASFDQQALDDLIEEFEHVRESNLFLFRHLETPAWERTGVSNGDRISVRALAYIIAGHVEHHLQVLRERYLS